MSTTAPTTAELSTSIVAQLEAQLDQTVPLLPKAFLRVVAKVLGAAVVILYRYAAFTHLQIYTRYATLSETEVNGKAIRPLLERGREVGVPDPDVAVRAELVVSVTVTTLTGSLTAGTQLLYSDTGVVYTVVADTALDASTISTTIRAASQQGGGDGSGEIGNLEIGDTLDFASPLPNVSRTVTVTSVAVVGAEAESEESYRARTLRRTQARPQGGAYADYQVWAEYANGVAAAYPYKGAPGEIDVYIESTAAVDPDGIPTAGVLTAAAAAINFDADGLARRRPANDKLNVLAIARTFYTVEATGLTADVPLGPIQDAINAGVDEFLRTRKPYIEGLSVFSREDLITQGAVAGVVVAIAGSYGASISAIAIKLAGSPITVAALAPGELAALSGASVTWL